MPRNRPNDNDENNDDELNGWDIAGIAGGIVGGIAAIAGGLYLYNRGARGEDPPPTAALRSEAPLTGTPRTRNERIHYQSPSTFTTSVTPNLGTNSPPSEPTMSDYLANFFKNLNTNNVNNNNSSSAQSNLTSAGGGRRGVPTSSIPSNPKITNLNGLLSDIYLRYIALNDQDFEDYYNVVNKIFQQIHKKMKEVDPYYQKYSSVVQFAGSHPDRLRINKPDEFDIDIVINTPLSINEDPFDKANSDFIIEPKDPGFVQLKMGVQYRRLHRRDGSEWEINKEAYEWQDDKHYLLGSLFSDWFQSVVDLALNTFKPNMSSDPLFYVDGVPYTISKSKSGPAKTIFVKNLSKGFKLDVDLVPALKFPIKRWPVCSQYRSVPVECSSNPYWMVVPKPNKNGQNAHDQNRSWRVAMHEQERVLMHDTNNMRQAIRLLKKFRDSQNMNKIASYYIKTLFFWEAIEHQGDRSFWNQSPAYLFKVMLKNFHDALVNGKIPYFWNKSSNLIGQVDKATLNRYAAVTAKLLALLDQPAEYKQVAKYLLTGAEFKEYSQKILNKL